MKILIITSAYFRKWYRDPKVWLSFGMGFVISFLLSDKVVSFSVAHETVLQVTESFIWTFGDAKSILLISLCLLLLFSDIPNLSNDVPFMLVRMNRRLWLTGQFVCVFLSTFIYVLFILLSTMLLSGANSYTANLWSNTAAILGYSGIGEDIAIPAFVKVLELSQPYQVMLHIFGLMLSYSLLMSGLVLTLNLYKGKLGMFGGVLLNCFGFLMNPETIVNIFHLTGARKDMAGIIFGWISPLNHATYYMHNFGYDMLPKLWMSYVYFAVLTLILFMTALHRIKKYPFNFTGTGCE
jgi:hypothetical protein